MVNQQNIVNHLPHPAIDAEQSLTPRMNIFLSSSTTHVISGFRPMKLWSFLVIRDRDLGLTKAGASLTSLLDKISRYVRPSECWEDGLPEPREGEDNLVKKCKRSSPPSRGYDKMDIEWETLRNLINGKTKTLSCTK
jgi:hypothetical protein